MAARKGPWVKRAFFGLVALASGAFGCNSTITTLIYTPVTGIAIDTASLVSGIGCGTGAGEVYKYAVVLSYASDAGAAGGDAGGGNVVISSVFDCFADGLFSNLPVSPAGSTSFTLAVFAFDAATFPPQLACSGAPGGPQGVRCPGDTPANVAPFESIANWTTTCTATQVVGVTVPAVCQPLVPRTVDAGALDSSADSSVVD